MRQPFTRFADRVGANKVAVYADRQNVLMGGELRNIDSLIQTIHNPITGEYVTRFGKEWIALKPHDAEIAGKLRAATQEVVVGPRHFGPKLFLAKLGREDIAFDVTHSAGVRKVARGWQFADLDDVRFGMFFGRWLSAMRACKGDCAIGDSSVELLLPGAADVPSDATIIDLDPDTVVYEQTQGNPSSQTGLGSSWAVCLAAAGTAYVGGQAVLNNQEVGGLGVYVCARVSLSFDTSAYAGATACVLRVNKDALLGTMKPSDIDVIKTDLAFAMGDYEAIWAARASGLVGPLVGADNWNPVQATSNVLGSFEAIADFELGLHCDVDPGANTQNRVTLVDSGDTRPSLLITMGVSPTSTSTSTVVPR